MTEVKNKSGKKLRKKKQTHIYTTNYHRIDWKNRRQKKTQANEINESNLVKTSIFYYKTVHVTWCGMREEPKRRYARKYANTCHPHTHSIRISNFFQCQTEYNEIDGQARAFQNTCIFIHFMRLLFNNNNISRYFYAVARERTYIFSKQTQSSETLSFVHLTRKPMRTIKEKTKCATSGNSQCNAVNINNYANEIWFNIKIPARKKEEIY